MEQERTVHADCMAAWILWALAVGLVGAGTIVGLIRASSEEVRVVAVSLFAISMLALGGACVMTAHIFIRRHTRLLLDAMLLKRTGEVERIRQMR